MRRFLFGPLSALTFLAVFHISSAFAGISCPESVTASQCDILSFSVRVDSTTDISDLDLRVTTDGSGEVSIDSLGRVSYLPRPFFLDEVVTIKVSAVSGSGEVFSCSTIASITNVAPTITCLRDAEGVRGRETTVRVSQGISGDCDALVYGLASVSPEPHGVVTVDSISGDVTFTADEEDADEHDVDYRIVVDVSDGHESDTCSFIFTVLHEEAFSFRIDVEDHGFVGGPAKLHVILDGGSENTEGFNLLLEYDALALNLREILGGKMFGADSIGSLSHQVEMIDGCSGNCPKGLVHLSGKVNSSSTESSLLQVGDTIVTLGFTITNDRAIRCQFVPVRWIWQDCEDNIVLSRDDDATYISRRVFDYVGTDPSNAEYEWRAELTGLFDTFPSLGGALLSCESHTRFDDDDNLRRFADFRNGGVKVICPSPIDARGDLNLNGVSYEMADFDLFIQYFLSGIGAFAGLISPEAAIAASEVNGDGIALTVADLVYFIRIFVGDAIPMNGLTHDRDTVTFQQSAGAVFSDLALGAVFFEFEGNPDVQLLDSRMEMRTGLVGGRKRVLIFKIGSEELAPGRFLLTDGKILSAQASDFNGSRVVVKLDFATDVTADDNGLVPEEFQLQQNYPNPFNPTTTIEFSIPGRGEVELTVYNTLGRKVRALALGVFSAGSYTVGWDGTDDDGKQVTTGVYYYRLRAGDVVRSRKMVLLK